MRETETVEIRVEIAAKPETVFGFFTDGDRFARWMGDGSTIEASVGGAVRVPYPNGDVAVGVVRELEAPSRIVLAWGYEGAAHGLPPASTRVEISLRASERGTELTLRHAGLPSEALRLQHAFGWRHYTSVLAAGSAREQLAEPVQRAVRAWQRAWSDERLTADELASGCVAAVEFRDATTSVVGREALAGHIVGLRAFAPAMELVAGEPELCHDVVRFRWRIETDGAVFATGWNFAEVAPDGRFVRIFGFAD